MLKIKNGKLVLKEIEKKNIYIENRRIVAITDQELPCEQELDAKGNYVSAGFIDVHVHGGGDSDFSDGGTEAFFIGAKTHLSHGTTTLCPTIAALPHEALKKTICDYKKAVSEKREDMPNFAGLHLEGPYLCPEQAGGQPPQNIYPATPDKYNALIELAEGHIKKWTFAPELEGALDFCKALKKNNIIASIGHTNATYDEIKLACSLGASCLTHLYSSMSTIVRKNSYRILGAVEAGYMLDDLSVEVIADGIHLPPELLSMIVRFCNSDKIILITDAMRGADMPEGPSVLGKKDEGHPCIIEDGIAKTLDRTSFAGSVATADRLIRTMVKKVGVSLPLAVKMMTENPARHLSIKDAGALKEGYRSDVVIFDDDIKVKTVIVGDKIIKNEL